MKKGPKQRGPSLSSRTKSSLHDWEEKYRLMVENVNDGVYLLNTDGRYIFVNRALEQRYGIPRERFQGLHYLELVSPRYRQRSRDKFERTVQGETLPLFELECLNPRGGTLQIEINQRALYKSGQVVAVQGISRDVTERRDASRALRESEEKFRGVAEHSPNMIFINLKGKVVYANHRCEEVMGYTREEICSPAFDFLTLIAPESVKKVKESFAKHLSGQGVAPYEHTLLKKNGDRIDAIITTRLIPYGNDQAILGIVTDITQRKRAESALKTAHAGLEKRVIERTAELARANKQLRAELEQRRQAEAECNQSEKRFRELSDLLPSIVFEVDRKGQLLYVNRAGFERFGYSEADFNRGPVANVLIAEKDLKRLQKNMARLHHKQRLGPGEYMAKAADGREFPVMIHSNAILDHKGRSVGIRGVMIDISDYKQAQQALAQTMRRLQSLASELSLAEERIRRQTAVEIHDQIAQNLALAKLQLGKIRRLDLPPDLATALEEIQALCDESMEGIRLLIAELSSPVLYELGLIPALKTLASQMGKRHGLNIGFHTEQEHIALNEDVKILVYQCVRELLINVTKHARTDSAEIWMRVRDSFLETVVADRGVGAELSRVGPQMEAEGGFGLFSIRERLESIGGRFRLESSPGNGTKVTLIAPLQLPSNGVKKQRGGQP
jgi:PAS domain S-box-containing protein